MKKIKKKIISIQFQDELPWREENKVNKNKKDGISNRILIKKKQKFKLFY
jgi:hypothetical protein